MRKLIVLLLIIMLSGCTSNKIENTNDDSSVYYQIFVGSFADSNDNGIGDINGIIEKLPYLNQLNIKGIWLTPIFASDTYHKYDVKDYYAIDEQFGSMDDFKNLIQEASKYNIDIIVDLVLNHTSDNHPWFIEAKKNALNNQCEIENSKCDYYNFYDENKSQTTRLSNNLYYQSVFTSNMPDLNLDNLEVRKEIENIVNYYLDMGVSGFRLDASLHYYGDNSKNIEFLGWLNQIVKNNNQQAYMVAEIWADAQTIQDHYQSGIDSLFNFPASYTDGKIVTNIRSSSGQSLANWIVKYNNAIKAINQDAYDSVFLSNHDQGRSGAFFKGAVEKQRLMTNVLMMAPGRIYIYYGEEIGMLGSGIDQNKRLAIPWSNDDKYTCDNPKESDYILKNIDNVDVQMNDKDSIWRHYQKLINIRNKYPQLEKAQVELYDAKDVNIYGIRHIGENSDVLVLHNFSDELTEIKIDGTIVQSDIVGKSTIKDNVLKLNAYDSVIIELRR